MKKTALTAALLAASAVLAGCANMNTDGLLSAGSNMVQAVSLSDAEVIQLSDAACTESDQQEKVAGAKSKYTVRLNKIMKGFGNETLNGQTPNYKVYLTPDVNAWAMANGCIRVYSGLMDLMNDDEVRGVIGHEMGHVALGHSKSAMQTAYAVSAARGAAASAGNSAVAALTQSQLGDLTEKFINAQFSQSQELAADDYSFDLLTQKKMNRKGLVTAFEKLAKLEGGSSDGHSMLSSHPASPERASRLESRLKGGK